MQAAWHFPVGPHGDPPARGFSPSDSLDDMSLTQNVPVQFPPMAGIVLAGGRSLRMGQAKALLPWPDPASPIVRHVTNTLRDAGLASLAVITGAHHDQIAPIFEQTDVRVLYNARHEDGQIASLQAGLRWAFAHPGDDWALVTLVDVPAVTSATVRRLLEHAAGTDALVIRPICDGRHGHPVLWRRAAAALLEGAEPAQGGRGVVRSLAAQGQVLDVPVDDQGVLVDVDTPAEYEALIRRHHP